VSDTTATNVQQVPDSLKRVLGEAFDLFDAHPDAARALYAQFARGVTSDGFSWGALARTHHEVLAERLARDPARAEAWSATAAALLASLAEGLHARLVHARSAETEKTRLDVRLDEQARALDEAAQALGDALEQSTGLRRQLEERASLLSSVLDAMASAVIAVSAEGHLILANSAARALGGVTAQGQLPDAATWTDT
jgi:PAS domain-containing protein